MVKNLNDCEVGRNAGTNLELVGSRIRLEEIVLKICFRSFVISRRCSNCQGSYYLSAPLLNLTRTFRSVCWLCLIVQRSTSCYQSIMWWTLCNLDFKPSNSHWHWYANFRFSIYKIHKICTAFFSWRHPVVTARILIGFTFRRPWSQGEIWCGNGHDNRLFLRLPRDSTSVSASDMSDKS